LNINPNGDGVRLSLNMLDREKPEGTVEYAAAYAGIGLGVVPNAQGRKRPMEKGWPELRLQAEDIPRYFTDGQNLGLLLGKPSGWLVDVDLDCPEARVVADRFLPDTLGGGRRSAPRSHRFFVSKGAKSRSWKLPGEDGTTILEVRSTGSQTLVEPSVHPSGERYEWDRKGTFEAVEIPAEQLELQCLKVATAAVIARRLPAEGRHHFAMALAGYLLRAGRLDEETTHRTLAAAWYAADAITQDAVRDLEGIVESTAKKVSSNEAVTGGPTLEELAPGLPKLFAHWWGWGEGSRTDASSGVGDEEPTHDVLRDRWLEAQEEPIAYGQSEWRRYGPGFWTPVHQESINAEIDRVLEEAKPEEVRPTAGMRSSVERMARAKVFVVDELWDADKDLIVCQNGTLEISSGTLREHRPEDYALGGVPFAFDPEARAPAFHELLATTIPEAAPFLQEFAGYSLTTDNSLETAVWLYGPPGSGKSTYIEGQRAMLGNRAGLLGLADIQRSRFALASLPGKTLMLATEQPSDFIHSTHVLNAIISGEEVTVERKFKDAFTVAPRAKLLWAMNDTPRVKDANDGLFRRVKVVSFPRLRVEPDPELKERIKGEGAGILNWALEGLRRLRERGSFEIPAAVQEATDEFRRTSDVPRMFVEEACITSDVEGIKERAQTLYSAYKHWCVVNGHKPQSKTALSREWRRMGFERAPADHGYPCYGGIKVDPNWIAAQDDYPRSR
jgi:putative DNA primase/helicase